MSFLLQDGDEDTKDILDTKVQQPGPLPLQDVVYQSTPTVKKRWTEGTGKPAFEQNFEKEFTSL